MFDKSKLDLVPLMTQDCAASALDERISKEIRETYIQRLETTRDYCNHILEQYQKSKKK